jgi:alginate O-acetyltransferase complex protein AlgI
MNVPSYGFLGFALLIALLINISSAPTWRRWVLIAANVAFFLSFSHDPVQLAPFVGLLALGFIALKIVERCKQRAVFVAFIVSMVALFCWMKQYAFVPHMLTLPFVYMTVGMSYVFFRILHLIIDAYEGSLPERIGLPAYISYTLSFTSLVSGPIQLYPDYHRMESAPSVQLNSATVGRAIERIIYGFFKVSILSPLFSYAHDRTLTLALQHSSLWGSVGNIALLVGVFPLYLYINFSGYMDFIIGVACFLRLDLPENFNHPFAAKGFIEFWGRWHMTLSQWFKTYVYSPLLMTLMRRFPQPRLEPILGVLVYFITFFLVGLWHGQTSMFLFYGILQGLGVSINKIFEIVIMKRRGRPYYRTLCAQPMFAMFSRGLTFTWFAFTLLWFWSSWGELQDITHTAGPLNLFLGITLLIVLSAFALEAYERVMAWRRGMTANASMPNSSRYMRIASYTALAVLTLTCTVFLNAPAPHVIYKAF